MQSVLEAAPANHTKTVDNSGSGCYRPDRTTFSAIIILLLLCTLALAPAIVLLVLPLWIRRHPPSHSVTPLLTKQRHCHEILLIETLD
jgi:hypothetical protein